MTKFELVENRLEELKQDYGKISQKDLEKKYDASYSTIYLVLHKHNLMLNRQNPVKHKYLREHKEEFIKDWIDGILNKNELEEKYRCPYSTMSFYSGELKITREKSKNKPKIERVGQETYNKNGELMRVVEYNNANDIIVEFQDKYKAKVHTKWTHFYKSKNIKNPYYPTVYEVGIIGEKYPITINQKKTKEYDVWSQMLRRCYDINALKKRPTYSNCNVCEEWLLYDNFYEWLHSQTNFEQWYNGNRWAIDKDILVKGNNIYSPTTCCLIPQYVNSLFLKNDADRGEYPIGVSKNKRGLYEATIIYGKKNNKSKTTGYSYPTPEDAFYLGYKPYKEAYIKRIAKEEYDKDNITKQCYEAMMNYQVEITD